VTATVMAEENLALPVELLGNVERYAVYRCYSDAGQLLYVGETGDLGTRLASHAQKLWFVQVRGITLEWYADELDALKAERRAIHVEHPKYNKQHRHTPLRNDKPRNGSQPRKTKESQHSPRRISQEALARQVSALLDQDPAISINAAARELGRGRDTVRPILQALRKEGAT